MKTTDYHTPTKEHKIFTVVCDAFGYIEGSYHYKRWTVRDICGDTFAIDFKDAVNDLHEWIIKNKQVIKNYPACKFSISVIDGYWDEKRNGPKETKVYVISARKAKALLF